MSGRFQKILRVVNERFQNSHNASHSMLHIDSVWMRYKLDDDCHQDQSLFRFRRRYSLEVSEK